MGFMKPFVPFGFEPEGVRPTRGPGVVRVRDPDTGIGLRIRDEPRRLGRALRPRDITRSDPPSTAPSPDSRGNRGWRFPPLLLEYAWRPGSRGGRGG